MKTFHRSRIGLGFTLVELMAVIAIVSVLLVILVVAISSIRSKVHSATCGTRLRQLGTAIQLYAADHKGALPFFSSTSGGDYNLWHRRVLPYMIGGAQEWEFRERAGELYLCPADESPFQSLISYGFNARLGGLRVSEFAFNPIMLSEASSISVSASGNQVYDYEAHHDGRGNVLFFDCSLHSYQGTPPPPSENFKLWSARL